MGVVGEHNQVSLMSKPGSGTGQHQLRQRQRVGTSPTSRRAQDSYASMMDNHGADQEQRHLRSTTHALKQN
jgi:hypothetical protein